MVIVSQDEERESYIVMVSHKEEMRGAGKGREEACDMRYLIVRPEKASLLGLLSFLVTSQPGVHHHEFIKKPNTRGSDDGDGGGEIGPVPDDHRWVIVVSIIARKIIAVFRKPMEWNGMLLEFILNLLSLNGGLSGLFHNIFRARVVMPRRGSNTFISAIGHLDPRVDLYNATSWTTAELHNGIGRSLQIGSKSMMDLCMMASKLSYENQNVVRNVVAYHWKMHFVAFYNCWNDYQKERSTQVFIFCDKHKDANLIIISFRGTEPFDADDWSTDFDYSWYEIPKLGKVHVGFLEALGLGSRAQASTFQTHLQVPVQLLKCIGSHGTEHPSDTSSLVRDEMTAYHAVRDKLKSLLDENKNAKFIVTGHSLGGALAILFPAVLLLHKEEELMKNLLGVYTFGQPRVGDSQLEKFMEAHVCHPVPKYFRVVYCNDLVPRLPYDDKTFLYKHFGLCLYYNSLYIEQNMEEEPNRNYFGLRYLLPVYFNAVWELIRSLTMGYIHGPEYKEGWLSIMLRILGLVMPGISAHSPTDYVNCIRLGRKEIQMASI